MKKITCVSVDDEPLARDLLRRFITEQEELELLGEAANGEDAVALVTRTSPDLLFLDIQMPEMSGFDVLDVLHTEGNVPVTVFVTAHDTYAVRAFESQALDYLQKPFDRERFRKCVESAAARIGLERRARYADRVEKLLAERKLTRVVVRTEGRLLLLRPADIEWVEARGNYVAIHAGAAVHTIRDTLRDFAARLPSSTFVRIHRSALVNVGRVAEIRPWYTGEYVIVLASGRELTLSRTYRDAFFESVGEISGAEPH